ncbi:MarR family transcriptional regulator [Thermococcus sp. M39]|uniref:MarR family winged helix-turn-helix transcriptional regulator n=1 Tax=unclassified Thermococcus TaxID=2627626 RepID=UPI00143BD8B8|nr:MULTISPECIES: helix-turn-helix domain-containing protein [unclassified Thermococcus]NJE09281.1 MarR family transcriptional regulator [Thermococcus sp. M39]NJE13864.1 MarR family transcriptional regulator [Thermococcus sp. LS2]
MTLTKSELRVLAALKKPKTLKELSAELGLSRATLSVLLHSLERKGLVELTKGKKLIATPSKVRPVELFHELLVKFPHVDFTRILVGGKLKAIAGMTVERPRPVWEILLKTNLSKPSLHRALNELMERLIVGKNEKGYFIVKRFALVKTFADEYFRLQNFIKAREFSNDAVLVWSGVDELILATSEFKGKSLGNFQLTGLSRFFDYGMSLISPGVYHYYWPSKGLTLEEVVVHTLTIESGARELLYVIALLKARGFNTRRLKRLAVKFDIAPLVEEILEYLKGKEKPYPFPSREEVEELYRQYFGGCGNDNKGKAD